MQESRGEGIARHEHGGEENVRQVRDRGVGEAALEVPLLERHARAIENRDQREDDADRLRPCAAQQLRAAAVVDKADAGEGARLHDGHRVQQRRDGGGRDGRRGQPRVQRPERRLDAEAHEREHEHRQKHRQIPAARRCQMPAGDELLRIVQDEKDEPDERQRRAGHGVEQVFDARGLGRGGHGLHDERERREGEQLVKEIHRQHVRRKGDAERHAEGGREERPEHGEVLFMAHVVAGIERRERPERG